MNLMNMAAQAILEQAVRKFASGPNGALVGTLVTLFQQKGGVQGIVAMVQNFEKNGLGQIVQSWISTGPNMPLSPQQVAQGMGEDQVQEIAAATGQTQSEASQQLAALLPELIDKMTPNGKIDAALIGQILSTFTQKKAA